MPKPSLINLVSLLLRFTCIDFRSIFFSRGISLVATAYHDPHATWKGLSINDLQNTHLSIKTGWQNIPLAFRSLAKPFKNNIICLDSLLLLFDSFWKMKAEYIVQEEKHTFFYFFRCKNCEASRNSLYHEVVYPGLYVSQNYSYLIEVAIFE